MKPYDVISHADANSGLTDRTETGTDDYTLIQTGTSGTKAYTLTVTGSDDYSLTTNSNTQDGGFTQSLTATGSYSREEHGDHSGTPYTLSDADDHSFDQLQTGNDVDAQSTQTTHGETRYDLLIDFTNPVESVTTGEGVTLFMAIGAPQALITDTAAPTGTMSDAGDIDHAYCFAKGTLVLMADGSRKAIETITPNELVLAVDENDPEAEAKPRKVVQVYHNAPAQIWYVRVNSETIRTTAGHPFHVKGKGWIKVAELQPGDELRDVEGKPVKVESVEMTTAVEPVLNLQVEDSHTYFVAITTNSIWVHNQSGGLAGGGLPENQPVKGNSTISNTQPSGTTGIQAGEIHEQKHVNDLKQKRSSILRAREVLYPPRGTPPRPFVPNEQFTQSWVFETEDKDMGVVNTSIGGSVPFSAIYTPNPRKMLEVLAARGRGRISSLTIGGHGDEGFISLGKELDGPNQGTEYQLSPQAFRLFRVAEEGESSIEPSAIVGVVALNEIAKMVTDDCTIYFHVCNAGKGESGANLRRDIEGLFHRNGKKNVKVLLPQTAVAWEGGVAVPSAREDPRNPGRSYTAFPNMWDVAKEMFRK